jgi:hypothetical protein
MCISPIVKVIKEWLALHCIKIFCTAENFPKANNSSAAQEIPTFCEIRKCITAFRMGERRGAYRALVGKPEGGNHLEDPGVDGRIILKWTFERLGVGAQTGLIWHRIGTGGGLLCTR